LASKLGAVAFGISGATKEGAMLKTVTKLEAAKRQLDTAICLHLNENDICAVQTLAWAALTLLRDLSESKPKVETG
jgi:hypothetical protein